MIDLDVLIFKKSSELEKIIKNNVGFVNDISSNVIPAYGYKKILEKLKLLDNKISKVEWYGGDFFVGNSTFLKKCTSNLKNFKNIFKI